MNTIFFLLLLQAFHSLFSLIRANPSEKSKKPLIFNPHTLTVFINESSNSGNSQHITYPVVAACPAETDEEKKMNDIQSKDHKALFIRKLYIEEIEPDDEILCEKDFELAVAVRFSLGPSPIEFGYEIYSEKSKIPETVINMETVSYFNYKSITSIDNRATTFPYLSENNSLSFIWLKTKIHLLYDPEFWIVTNVTYTLYRSADKFGVKCDDNNLGKQFYEEAKVNLDGRYYSKNNKNGIFGMVDLPKESTCKNEENQCLEKYNLLMPYHFQPSPSSTVSCSNLTSITIWYEVSKQLLDYSEKFLAAISEITTRKLHVISGSYGILSLPYTLQTKIFGKIEMQEIFLDSANRRFPVPRIIYKIVKYQSHDCYAKIDLCWFDMVIVIHNEPKITGKKLCNISKCQKWGWNSIRYLSTTDRTKGSKSKFIYCCELNAKLRDLLNYKVDYERNNLNLGNFPYDYNESERKIEYKNMKEEFKNKMKELFEQ